MTQTLFSLAAGVTLLYHCVRNSVKQLVCSTSSLWRVELRDFQLPAALFQSLNTYSITLDKSQVLGHNI